MYSSILAKRFYKNRTKHNSQNANISVKLKRKGKYWSKVRVLLLHPGLA